MMYRVGDWIQTRSGRRFWPVDPRADEIEIEDVAHALARQCRFSGHCEPFYSVAEHSVRVSRVVPEEYALWGLLHDASEAYLVDLPRPLKLLPEFAPYRAIEQRLMLAVCEKFGLPAIEPACVKVADNTLLATEARDLMVEPPVSWPRLSEPLTERIVPWSVGDAQNAFMLRFEELFSAVRRFNAHQVLPSGAFGL